MVTNEFVPKSELLTQLRSIFDNKESGMLTLLTQSKQSVLMRFSDGQLTSARCKNWELENTISALLENEKFKYSYMPSAGEDKLPLIAPNDFLMMIDPGGIGLSEVSTDESTVEETINTDSAEVIEADNAAEATVEEVEKVGEDVDRAIAAKMNYF